MAAKHVIKHDLDLALARKVTDKAFEAYAERFKDYSPAATWVTDTKSEITFNAKGLKLNGEIELKPDAVELELEVPFLLRPFQRRAIQIIDEEIRGWIAKAKSGEIE